MGTFSWPVEIQGLDGGPRLRIEAMVDTGATFTVIPGYRLSEIGISPSRRAKFEYGDGRPVDLHIAEARATIDGESAITQVVFGADDSQPLLGSYTLYGLLLAVDPVNERLVSTHGILY